MYKRNDAFSGYKPFASGEQVKLTEQGIRAYHAVRRNYQGHVDWTTRVGVVVSYKNTGEAYVRWEGRTSLDVVPVKILENPCTVMSN
jgi:hypothetical protein